MSIVVMGISHKNAPLSLLERYNVSEADLPTRLARLTQHQLIAEAVIVSTCNRTEAYLAIDPAASAQSVSAQPVSAQPAIDEMRQLFASALLEEPSQHAPDLSQDLSQHLYIDQDSAAASHLFATAAGIESAVIGETEILGQIKAAWETARNTGTSSNYLNQLFRHAIEAAKRCRTETDISRHTSSVPHSAVAMATSHLGPLANRKALVVGAGEMAEAVAIALSGAGLDEVLVANRTPSHATELAQRVSGRTIALDELQDALAEVDLLLTATGASETIIQAAHIDTVVKQRAGSPLLIVDIAVPRDVDPSVSRINGVTLLDMDDLTRFAARGRSQRQDEIAAVQEIVSAEVDRFAQLQAARTSAPVIAALRSKVEATADVELERIFRRHPDWDASHRAAVEAMTKSLLGKILHQPTVALKEAAGSEAGDRMAETVRRLFDI